MGEESWLEVSLLVDGETAEAISEVLARFVSGGVVIESTQIAQDIEGLGKVVGPLRVCGYLEIDDQLENKRQDLEKALWHLGQIRPVPEAQYKPVEEIDWSEIWKQHFHPIPIGKRLIIIPAWLDIEAGERTAVRIDPGMAFGTGTHPSTQLCLEILEDILGSRWAESQREDHSRLTMIDVGCGSGILGIAAAKLGVSYILGVDQDQKAVDAAHQNAVANGVQGCLELVAGSVRDVRAGKFSIKRAPIVVANILAPVLVRLLEAGMKDLVTPEGKLVLSGILEEQIADVQAATESHRLHLEEKCQLEDWVALVVTKPV